jgi:hypothetical protein
MKCLRVMALMAAFAALSAAVTYAACPEGCPCTKPNETSCDQNAVACTTTKTKIGVDKQGNPVFIFGCKFNNARGNYDGNFGTIKDNTSKTQAVKGKVADEVKCFWEQDCQVTGSECVLKANTKADIKRAPYVKADCN